MRFTLISPRITIQKGDFLGSGVPYWPIELAILAAFMKGRGHEVSVIDLFGSSPATLEERDDHYLQGISFNSFLDDSAVHHADYFILYAASYMSHKELISIIDILRKMRRDDAKIAVLENTQAVTAYALSAVIDDLFTAGANALLCGEVYWNWEELEAFLAGNSNKTIPDNILVPEIATMTQPKRRINKTPTYPLPAWEHFNLKNYWSLPYSHGPKTARYLPILTSRGCAYNCDFCVTPATNLCNWRGRRAEEVVDEIITLKNRYGVRHFQVEDLNPTLDGRRWEQICELLIERNADVNYYFVSGTKAETIKISQIPLYAKSGCRYISISPESGSPSVLREMGKPFDYEHGKSLVETCYEHGIYTQACFLVGHPSEKETDHKQSCDYLRTLVRVGLDEVAVFIVAPVAGSKLFGQGKINLATTEALPSFSPKGRVGWESLARKRQELINIFFKEKMKKGFRLWIQGARAILGIPRTKMENLLRRIMFIYWQIGKYKMKHLLGILEDERN